MKKSTGKSRTALFWHLAKKELLARRLSSALSLAAIAFAATLALTITLYLTGTQIQQEKILGNMQHVMYMDIQPEQLQAIGADERVEMCVPYKPLDTEFEMDGVKFSLVYYESVPAGIQTYTVSEGRPPEAYNEIVVDKSFMDALGQESVLGKELTLDLNGRTETFLISGYTDDAYSTLTHPVRVSQSFAEQSPEMSSVPYTALVRLHDASEMPPATFSTTVYQIALDYGVARANVNINGTFETSLQSGNTALYVIVLLAIMIAVACGIVIYSIFYLSVSSSTQRLGQYLTIGMTKKQMRGLIRREGFLLTLLALPVSLVVSAGIAWLILPDGWSMTNYLFLCGITVACATVVVQISVGKPAAVAAKLPPVEALRGNLAEEETTKRHKSSQDNLTIFRLARIFGNAGGKKWIFTTLSLAFSGILFMTAATWMASWDDKAYSRQNGFQDNEYHISYLYDHSYPKTYGTTEMQLTGHLSEELYQQISAIPHVEHVAVEHSAFANISYQGASFLQSFYPLTADSEEYFMLEAEGNNSYDYLSEHDGILITNSTFSESINGIDFQPGDTVTLHYFDGEEHTVELEIAAVSEEYVDAGNDRPTFCMADTTMQKLWNGMNTASMFYITADNYTEYGAAVEEEIRSKVEQYDDLSLWTLREQSLEDSSAIQQQKQQIYGISILLILFSIFNLINTVISGFATRKREFSVLESLGMEQRQLRKMLFFENIIQMLPSLILTFSVGTLAGFALIQFLRQSATYLQYTFPIMAAIFYLLALLGLPLILTAGCLRTQEKIPLVERIRYVE
jgi:putative ABC transport system permease protein